MWSLPRALLRRLRLVFRRRVRRSVRARSVALPSGAAPRRRPLAASASENWAMREQPKDRADHDAGADLDNEGITDLIRSRETAVALGAATAARNHYNQAERKKKKRERDTDKPWQTWTY